MCGFAGVVVWDETFRVSRQTLERMSARIAHRGPDGQGLHLSVDSPITPDRPQVGLAHRRLAILDLDARANQPFSDAEGRWIVFNGEIYNFRELRSELSNLRPGYMWRTQCDTEVLLVAYDVWGQNCVEHLNGMFAFAVWDEPAKTLFLARDRMGQKPLYVVYVTRAGTPTKAAIPRDLSADFDEPPAAVAFASELSALMQLSWANRSIDHLAVVEYLRWGYVPHPLSIYSEIRQIPPGNTTRITPKKSYPGSYFYPGPQFEWGEGPREYNDAEAVPRTRDLVIRAVKRQLVSDVPLGCFLSGGVDSSIIASAMRSAVPRSQPVLTFSIGFDDARYDETRYAAQIAGHLGTEHRTFTVKPDAASDLPLLARSFGEPFGDSSALPTHYLARETRKYVNVALSGDGGDELFGGYDRYRALLYARRLRFAFTPLPWWLLGPVVNLAKGGRPKSRSARTLRFLQSLAVGSSERYQSYLRVFGEPLLRSLLARGGPELEAIEHPRGGWDLYRLDRHGDGLVPAALTSDRRYYLPDDLLTKVDRASMLHALEVRSPFMDPELVRFAANLRTPQLLKGGPKRMLREAFARDLPGWVFKRKKMGFAVPIGDWFRGDLRPMLRDHLFAADSFASGHFNRHVVERMVDEHEQNRVDHSQRLYALLMLELWWRIEKR